MLSGEQLAQYDRDGFLVIENFFDKSLCDKLSKEVDKIHENVVITQDLDKVSTYPFFSNTENVKPEELDYFLNSGNKIRLFMNNKYMPDRGSIKLSDKAKLVRKNANKIGHALHAFNPVFKEATFSQKVKDICKSLDHKKPVVCQSMYVLKQAFSEPNAPGHQDSTYLQVEPNTLIGFWVAIEDSTPENGCLKFIPGSHKDGLKRKYNRNHDENQMMSGGKALYYTSEAPKYDQNRFVDVPIKAGSAILINGLVVHKSTSTRSPSSRDVYAFHVFDDAKSAYSSNNWMDYTPETFLPLY